MYDTPVPRRNGDAGDAGMPPISMTAPASPEALGFPRGLESPHLFPVPTGD